VNLAFLFASNGANLWLPQIVQTIGYSTLVTSLLATLPSLAGVPAMILLGRSSDRHKERVLHIAAAGLVAALGFFLVGVAPSDLRLLAAITVAYIGLNAMNPIMFGLLADYLAGPALAGGVALVLSVGNIGSFAAPTIIGILKERTGGFSAAMMIVAAVLLAAVGIVLAVGYSLRARQSTSAAAVPS
jgi:cyanate permease